MQVCKNAIVGFAASVLVGVANLTSAAAISIEPDPIIAQAGTPVFLDLLWDGNGASTSILGGWDLDLTFDSSVISYQSTQFDPDDGLLDNFGLDLELIPGLLNLSDLSFSSSPDLASAQNGLGNTFVLATLEFAAIGVGTTDLVLTGNAFSDADASGLEVALTGGSAEVIGEVPEPGMLSLTGLGLFLLILARRRRR